jgi:hypothetical protein
MGPGDERLLVDAASWSVRGIQPVASILLLLRLKPMLRLDSWFEQSAVNPRRQPIIVGYSQ